KIPDESFDAVFCSNVLDVIPSETAVLILNEFARIMRNGAKLIVGMNYYLSPEKAAKRNLDLKENGKLYVDGVLRMVSKSDEEWITIFAEWFRPEKLDHFAWPSEETETRRLFEFRKK
ncbi:MAG: class I SAM-dependent methyltransferase, partial [Erysipelotrichaceae bacterium]|nr:class I SAM-dependent methyltransferase [Erysipelotrichaceae bacterium]